MIEMDELRTDRLVLRSSRPQDEAEMARINRDPEVGRYLNRPTDEEPVAGFFALAAR
jgi:hypothetical protein